MRIEKRLLTFFAIILIESFLVHQSLAQKTTWGDTSVVRGIDAKASYIYEHSDTTLHWFTKKQFQKTPSFSHEIRVAQKDGKTNKIVVISTKSKGVLAHEMYLHEGKIIFAYQTFGYFREIKTGSKFVNFEGNQGWESRYYFENDKLAFYENDGLKEKPDDYTATDFLKEIKAVEQLFKTIKP
jgi:hypothetical protein